MRDVRFTAIAFEHYNSWQTENKQIFEKLKKLLLEVTRNPFEGTGKPEPLKRNYAGYWSRRITDEHRLIYKVESDCITVIACKYHYGE
jgi:toxin YoeB